MTTNKLGWLTLAFATSMMLSACGGSDDSSPTPTPPPPPPAPASLTISGTASTGPALASAAVHVTCAAGDAADTTTGTDGTFRASIVNGKLPCVLRSTAGDGGLLHSVAAGDGSATTATANITPLTELVTANVAGGSPDALSTTFDAAAQAKVTPTTVATAITTTSAALLGTVDLTGANPLTDALIVSNGTAAGNAADQQITALTTAIANSGTTLAAVTTAVGSALPTTPPILHQVAAQSASCSALRSGTYRILNPHESADSPTDEALRVIIDAHALTATDTGSDNDTSSTQLTPVDGTPCSFTYPDEFGTGTLLVSTGGVIVARSPSSTGPIRTSFIIPEQTTPLAQVAGTWNFLTYQRDDPSTALTPASGTLVFDAAGHATSGTQCDGLTCSAMAAGDLPPVLTVDALGGFDAMEDPVHPTRLFLVTADNGAKTIFVLLPNELGVTILTQTQTLTLPTVGTASKFWDFTVGSGAFAWAPTNDANGGASTLHDYIETVTAVDATAQSFTRVRTSDQSVDTYVINAPRDGLRDRTASPGRSATISMPLSGLGVQLAISVLETDNFFDISVDHN